MRTVFDDGQTNTKPTFVHGVVEMRKLFTEPNETHTVGIAERKPAYTKNRRPFPMTGECGGWLDYGYGSECVCVCLYGGCECAARATESEC